MRGLFRKYSRPLGSPCFATTALLAGAAVLWPLVSRAQSGVIAGEFMVERPTLASLGFEWRIAGDENRNATVEVALSQARARRTGGAGCRCFACRTSRSRAVGRATSTGTFYIYTAANMFAGSILNLAPGTRLRVPLRPRATRTA